MSDQTQQQAAAGDAVKKRFRFSLAQLLGIVLALGIAMGTLRLVDADGSQPRVSIVAGIGFAAAALVFLRTINARLTLTDYVVVVVIIGLLAGWLMPGVPAAKEGPSRSPWPTGALPVPAADE